MKTQTKEVLSFFVLTFAISWILWIPKVFWPEVNFFQLISMFGPFGPLFSALILVAINQKNNKNNDELPSAGNFFKSKLHSEFSKKWYIPLLLLGPIMNLITWMIITQGLNQEIVYDRLADPLGITIGFFYILLLGGPLGEEHGWRGYAIERMVDETKNYSSKKNIFASILLGLIWSIWHLPLFFMEGTVQYNIDFWQYTIQTVILAVIYTLIYYKSNKSVWAAILFHTTMNLAMGIFPTFVTFEGRIIGVILLLLITITFYWKFRDEKLVEKSD